MPALTAAGYLLEAAAYLLAALALVLSVAFAAQAALLPHRSPAGRAFGLSLAIGLTGLPFLAWEALR